MQTKGCKIDRCTSLFCTWLEPHEILYSGQPERLIWADPKINTSSKSARKILRQAFDVALSRHTKTYIISSRLLSKVINNILTNAHPAEMRDGVYMCRSRPYIQWEPSIRSACPLCNTCTSFGPLRGDAAWSFRFILLHYSFLCNTF